ncbi:MAG: 2'-5' RNA ligase family protein, partial [candidate division Zixibacteria bacterium]
MRLFIALPLTDEVERGLADVIAQLQRHSAPVKWVEPSKIHLTIRFLGDTERSLLPEIKSMIDSLSTKFELPETT